MEVFVLVEDPREDGEVLLVTTDESIAVRGAIEILRQSNPAQIEHSLYAADSFELDSDDGHIWADLTEFDNELNELGEEAFWSKYNNAWAYCVCGIWPMQVMS